MEYSGNGIWLPEEILTNPALPPNAKFLFGVISCFHTKGGCFLSNNQLGETLRLTPINISNNIKILRENGLIGSEDRPQNGRQMRCLFVLGSPFPLNAGINPALMPALTLNASINPTLNAGINPALMPALTLNASINPTLNAGINPALMPALTPEPESIERQGICAEAMPEISESAQNNITKESTNTKDTSQVKRKEFAKKLFSEPEQPAKPKRVTAIQYKNPAFNICIEIWMQYLENRGAEREDWQESRDAKEPAALSKIIEKLTARAERKLPTLKAGPAKISSLKIAGEPFRADRINPAILAAGEDEPLCRQICDIFTYILNNLEEVKCFYPGTLELTRLKSKLPTIMIELTDKAKAKGQPAESAPEPKYDGGTAFNQAQMPDTWEPERWLKMSHQQKQAYYRHLMGKGLAVCDPPPGTSPIYTVWFINPLITSK